MSLDDLDIQVRMFGFKDWPQLTTEELAPFSELQRNELLKSQKQLVDGNNLQLMDLVTNCRSEMTFAKTYMVLREEALKTCERLATMAIARAQGQPEEFWKLVETAHRRVYDYKLAMLATYFEKRWGSPIFDLVGSQASYRNRGCLPLVIGFLVASSSVAGIYSFFSA